MKNKINLIELLKDCPRGMELDCTVFEDVYFDSIDEDRNMIQCYIQNANHKTAIAFNKYGHYSDINKSKCVIFPKGKTTWIGFHRPFKGGDVVVDDTGAIFLYKQIHTSYRNSYADFYCGLSSIFRNFIIKTRKSQHCGEISLLRFATEEEKQKLFDAIKANNYKWNAEAKTLEKLIDPKFKIGDRIKKNKDYISGIVTNISDDGTYKVEYQGGGVSYVSVAYQDEWELLQNKFDITTLKPFDKVLTRANDDDSWVSNLYSHRIKDYYAVLNAELALQCIPYEGNEHLLGKTDNCSDFYKTWE